MGGFHWLPSMYHRSHDQGSEFCIHEGSSSGGGSTSKGKGYASRMGSASKGQGVCIQGKGSTWGKGVCIKWVCIQGCAYSGNGKTSSLPELGKQAVCVLLEGCRVSLYVKLTKLNRPLSIHNWKGNE